MMGACETSWGVFLLLFGRSLANNLRFLLAIVAFMNIKHSIRCIEQLNLPKIPKKKTVSQSVSARFLS